MDIIGTIIMDLPLQEGVSKSGNNWKKKEWVLETKDNFPKKVKFHVFGERRVAELNFEIGKTYRIGVDIESREFNGRWYTDVNALNATLLEEGMMGGTGISASPMPPFGQPESSVSNPQSTVQDPFGSSSNDTDDLPF